MMNIRRKFWDIKMKIFSLLNKDAKILYDTMKELQIPENQLYLHDDESCVDQENHTRIVVKEKAMMAR